MQARAFKYVSDIFTCTESMQIYASGSKNSVEVWVFQGGLNWFASCHQDAVDTNDPLFFYTCFLREKLVILNGLIRHSEEICKIIRRRRLIFYHDIAIFFKSS